MGLAMGLAMGPAAGPDTGPAQAPLRAPPWAPPWALRRTSLKCLVLELGKRLLLRALRVDICHSYGGVHERNHKISKILAFCAQRARSMGIRNAAGKNSIFYEPDANHYTISACGMRSVR